MNTNDANKTCPKCGLAVPAQAPEGLCPKCVLAAAASSEPAPTATAQLPSLDRVAAAFPQLEILELIGRGGMGFVFKARQPQLDRLVALKLLPDSLAQDPQFAERFNREGRTLARLNHPNIVSIFDFGYAGAPPQTPDAIPHPPSGFYYLLMEYVDGVNLRQAMQAGRFSPSEALSIVPKICEALQYAHEEGVLHRDIKPENILLDAKGRVKIADFGIAKIVGEDKPATALTLTGATLGTPHYMAPEQLEKPGTVDHRADIYSLGVVFYEMLTGELPLGRFAAPSAKAPLDERIDEIVFRALEKEREKRFQSAGEVKTTVEHVTEAGAGSFKGAPPKAAGAEPQRGPSGRMSITPDNILPNVPPWSKKAFWAAALTCNSLILLLCLALSYLGGTVSSREGLLIGSFPPGLAGTILGWVALNDIRAHAGRLRGLPVAVFSALTLPLGLLLAGTVVAPLVFVLGVAQAHGGSIPLLSTTLVLLVSAGAITFSIWAIYAAARWGANQPAPERRGKLKWIFLAVMAGGLGFVALSLFSQMQGNRAQPPVAAVQATTARVELVSVARHPSEGTWWKPDGTLLPDQDVGIAGSMMTNRADNVFQFAFAGADSSINPARIFRFDGGQWSSHPFPERAGWPLSNGTYVVCLFPVERRQTDIRVGEASGPPQQTFRVNIQGQRTFTTRLTHENGVATFFGQLTNHLGASRLTLTNDLLNHDIRVVALDRDGHEHVGRNSASATWDDDEFTFVNLAAEEIRGLRLELRRYRWMEITNVALQPRPSSGPAGIRFTITRVEIREEQDDTGNPLRNKPIKYWLRIDYTDEAHGSAEKAFSCEANISGFKAKVNTGERVNNSSGLPVTDQHIVEYLLPYPSGDSVRVYGLRDGVRQALEHKNFQLALGEEKVLFEISNLVSGPLKARLKVVPSSGTTPQPVVAANTTPWIRFTITAVELLEKGGQSWLAFDYQDQVFGDCAKAFPWDSTTTGFKGVTRTSEFLGGDKSAPVRHQRVEYQLSGGVSRDALKRLRDEVAGRWLQKTFRLNLGEQRLLFEVLTPDGGALQGRVKVVPPAPRPVGTASNSPLEFRLIADNGDAAAPADELPERQRDGSETRRRVLRAVMLDGSAVARASFDPEPTGTPAISVRLNAEGARQFAAITAANIGRALAIVANGRIVSAPIIRSTIAGGELKISGAFSDDEARQLVATLNHQPAGLEFGPVVERVVADSKAKFPDDSARFAATMMIDFDTGSLHAGSKEMWDADAVGQKRWMQRNQIDALAVVPEVSGLVVVDMVAIPVADELWEQASGEEVLQQLQGTVKRANSFLSARGPGPATWLFRTREGGTGILQITGFTDNPRGVKIRYKLVTEKRALQPGSSPSQALLFGPVTEQFMADGTAIDLVSTGVKLVPASLAQAIQTPEIDVAIGDWLMRQDMDIAYLGQGRFCNSGQDLMTLTGEEWDDFSPAQLESSLHPNGKEVASRFDDKKPLAFTYGFKTRAGRLGLLQITGYPGQAGVKIRYKLALGAAVPSAIPTLAQNHSFGPEVERTLPLKYNGSEGLSEKLDLDSGIISPRATNGSGIYASHLKWAGSVSLSGVHGTLVVAVNTNLSVSSDRWNSLSANEVNEMMADAHANPEILVGVSDRYHTYLFKTAANRIGILKTSGHNNSEGGVKIRYKLVQTETDAMPAK